MDKSDEVRSNHVNINYIVTHYNFMKKIQDIAGFLFIVCVSVLSIIAILGVWDVFADDVISKSFQTIGLLAAVAVIVIIAGRFIDSRKTEAVGSTNAMGNPIMPTENINPLFTSIRHVTLVVLIVAVVMLALLGIMAIWDVLADKVAGKSIGSIAIVAFAAFIIVLTCLERENHKLLHSAQNKRVSVGRIILYVILVIFILQFFVGWFRFF